MPWHTQFNLNHPKSHSISISPQRVLKQVLITLNSPINSHRLIMCISANERFFYLFVQKFYTSHYHLGSMGEQSIE